ncbi:DinB family protein [Cellulomonas palmilytica]|uniref:DinB family protein n=1 Tax=Cellulomonas palmilytica TaxID=2608402 RepID=UPI001F194998|nr:DinB family protein [Cellulomonas palmilytica]
MDAQPGRAFGWSDMWAAPEDDPREQGGPVEGERATLVRYLRDRRLTLEMKCEGLSPEQLARRSVEPSDMSLLGIVRHLAEVEQYWFRIVMAGEHPERHFRGSSVLAFREAVGDDEHVTDAWARWRSEVAYAERLVDESDLSRRGTGPEQPELREVVVHMIEEYARHLGHADLLRERIDGRIGQ